jgi:hypothetical protein
MTEQNTDDDSRRFDIRPILATVVVLGVAIGALYLAVTLTNIIYAVLLSVAFAAGALLLPLFLLIAGPNLPAIARELLAWFILVLAALPYPRAVLEQQPDRSYRLVPEQDHDGAESSWTKWLYTDFAIGLHVSDDTWQDLAVDRATKQGLNQDARPDGGAIEAPIERNGEPTFVPERIGAEKVVIPLAEPLSRLQNAAGVLSGFEAESAGLEEYGGDTGGHSTKVMLAGMVTFVLLGIGLGWLMFW